MREGGVDLDMLATYLKSEIEEKSISMRGAAREIGCSPATLSRLLKGTGSQNIPDAINLMRAASWLGKSLTEFEPNRQSTPSKLADVEMHLRALPGLSEADAAALMAMVRAGYESAKSVRAGKRPKR